MKSLLIMITILASVNVLGSSTFCDNVQHITSCEEFVVTCVDDEVLRVYGSEPDYSTFYKDEFIPDCESIYSDEFHGEY